jgi:hypothetical protein
LWCNVEAARATEVPGAVCRRFVVDDGRAAKWQEEGDVVIEGAIEVLPSGHARRDGGLVTWVERELGLRKE